jgi:hypothetical protein
VLQFDYYQNRKEDDEMRNIFLAPILNLIYIYTKKNRDIDYKGGTKYPLIAYTLILAKSHLSTIQNVLSRGTLHIHTFTLNGGL